MQHRLIKFVLSFIVSLLFAFQQVMASSSTGYKIEDENKETNFGIGYIFSQINIDNSIISGHGVRLFFDNQLNDQFYLSAGFSQIYGKNSSSSTSSSTQFQTISNSVDGSFFYSLHGQKLKKERKIFNQQRELIAQINEPEENFYSVGLGVDQYWFNGSESVFPASGFSLILNSQYVLFEKYKVNPQIKYTVLSSGSTSKMNVTSFVLSIMF